MIVHLLGTVTGDESIWYRQWQRYSRIHAGEPAGPLKDLLQCIFVPDSHVTLSRLDIRPARCKFF